MTDAADALAPELRLESHRSELIRYCHRILGSTFEAEDAVQETLLRAWRKLDSFEGRASLRSWLYRIATNVCIDMVSGSRRRVRPVGLAPVAFDNSPLARSGRDGRIAAIHDSGALSATVDPAEAVELRERVRLAFIALHHLPPTQRAVLILRDVLRWRAEEVAQLLGTSAKAVNSALQRARSTLPTSDGVEADAGARIEVAQRALLARYIDAFERYDVAALVSLLRRDAVSAKPARRPRLQAAGDVAWSCRRPGSGRGASHPVAIGADRRSFPFSDLPACHPARP